MLLEGVLVSVDYGDYLRFTLPANRRHFDRLVVVTTAADRWTREVSAACDAEVVVTDAFYREGAAFHKAAGVNAGFAALERRDWVLHLDGDVVLPPDFRPTLEALALDRETLYGVRRKMCPDHASWERARAAGWDLAELRPERPIVMRNKGYVPLGYFQLFHARAGALAGGEPWYPEGWGFADQSDVRFSLRWARRRLIPTFDVVHLDEGAHVEGGNWGGRRSPRFGPPPPGSPGPPAGVEGRLPSAGGGRP